MRTSSIFTSLLSVLLFSCSTPQQKIKENLKSRYSDFEIIEIREDSANIITAYRELIDLSLKVSTVNLDVITRLNKIDKEKNKSIKKQMFFEVDSIYWELTKRIREFEDSRYSRCDACYFVSYRYAVNGIKNSQEEYFYIDNDFVYNRSTDWPSFLRQEGYPKLLEEKFRFYPDILQYRSEITGTSHSKFGDKFY